MYLKLAMNYSAIYEINSDIINFKLKAINNTELQSLMQLASNITSRIRNIQIKSVYLNQINNARNMNKPNFKK